MDPDPTPKELKTLLPDLPIDDVVRWYVDAVPVMDAQKAKAGDSGSSDVRDAFDDAWIGATVLLGIQRELADAEQRGDAPRAAALRSFARIVVDLISRMAIRALGGGDISHN